MRTRKNLHHNTEVLFVPTLRFMLINFVSAAMLAQLGKQLRLSAHQRTWIRSLEPNFNLLPQNQPATPQVHSDVKALVQSTVLHYTSIRHRCILSRTYVMVQYGELNGPSQKRLRQFHSAFVVFSKTTPIKAIPEWPTSTAVAGIRYCSWMRQKLSLPFFLLKNSFD